MQNKNPGGKVEFKHRYVYEKLDEYKDQIQQELQKHIKRNIENQPEVMSSARDYDSKLRECIKEAYKCIRITVKYCPTKKIWIPAPIAEKIKLLEVQIKE